MLRSFVMSAWLAVLLGCATDLPIVPEQTRSNEPVVLGRTIAVLTGETSRWYRPQLRFMEIMNRQTLQRYSIEVASEDKLFVLQLPAGHYALTRVQISEGPFMSIADYDSSFQVGEEPITYVGTWRFGIDSPRYGRMIVLSAVRDEQEESLARQALVERFPALDGQQMKSTLPRPNEIQTRLYEVMPYPRYPRYFRRHWW